MSGSALVPSRLRSERQVSRARHSRNTPTVRRATGKTGRAISCKMQHLQPVLSPGAACGAQLSRANGQHDVPRGAGPSWAHGARSGARSPMQDPGRPAARRKQNSVQKARTTATDLGTTAAPEVSSPPTGRLKLLSTQRANLGQGRWRVPVTPVLGRVRQEGH